MLESESSALPFGDIPLLTTMDIIHDANIECKPFLFGFFKIQNDKSRLILYNGTDTEEVYT